MEIPLLTLNQLLIPLLPPSLHSRVVISFLKDNGGADELSDIRISQDFCDAECDHENDLLLETILNSEPLSPLPNHANYFPEVRKELKNCEAKIDETSIDEPPEVELKDLPSHLEYAFLEGNDKLPVIIAKDLSIGEKAALIKVLQSHKRAIAWKLSDIKGPWSNSTLSSSHFMVKEGIVLGHKISKSGIEVDRAKTDVITKLPHPTTVKGVRSFLGHAGFYRRFIQNFSKIARPMTHLLEKETPFYFSKECIEAFNTLKKNLTEAPILIAPDWNEPNELNELRDEAYENSLIYKEKTKRIHDSKIKNHVKYSDLKQALRGRHLMLIVDCPDYEDSRALSFVFYPQEFHILSFILGIQYPNLID
ncbi:hypothetical protein Tco_0946146 [Tanacetum coccineum]